MGFQQPCSHLPISGEKENKTVSFYSKMHKNSKQSITSMNFKYINEKYLPFVATQDKSA